MGSVNAPPKMICIIFVLGKNNELTRVMENVVNVNPVDGKVYLTDLLGEEKILDIYEENMDFRPLLEEKLK